MESLLELEKMRKTLREHSFGCELGWDPGWDPVKTSPAWGRKILGVFPLGREELGAPSMERQHYMIKWTLAIYERATEGDPKGDFAFPRSRKLDIYYFKLNYIIKNISCAHASIE